MNIQQAIAWLQLLQKEHGPTIQVFFDCPKCGESFTPGSIAVQTLHVKARAEVNQ